MPAKYVRPYSKGQKNDFRDAEAIAEAVQRPTMKFVATKIADQLGRSAKSSSSTTTATSISALQTRR
jgi:transposase